MFYFWVYDASINIDYMIYCFPQFVMLVWWKCVRSS